MAIFQGDSYAIPFYIKDNSGTAINPSEVSAIEFCLGNLVKYYPEDITADESTDKFYLRLTQEESINLESSYSKVQVRVKLANGDVIGTNLMPIDIGESVTKKVI